MTYLSFADKGTPCHCPEEQPGGHLLITPDTPDRDEAIARILRHHHVCVWESTLRRMTPRVRVNAAVYLPSCGVAA